MELVRALIVSNYESLVDDFSNSIGDLVYSGLNCNGDIIIGSVMDEIDEDKEMMFMHSIISKGVYDSFINKEITYLELLNLVIEIFVINESYDRTKLDITKTTLLEIDNCYIPLQNSYLP